MPVDIKGKTYWTVAERLTMAHGEGDRAVGIQSILTTVEAVGNLVVVHATVTFQDGRAFDGMSLVNMNATGPAERDAPLETCETSAVGRALAMAGYFGSPEGIAGAEELHLAQARAEARLQAVPGVRYGDGSTPATRVGVGTAAPRPVGNPGGPSPAQVRYLATLWGQAKRPMPLPDAEAMSKADVSKLIDELRNEVGVPPAS